jgi:valyl-tRNA synthetase
VRNENGQKISKSMENIDQYDPLNIIDTYGTDALRYTLMTSATPGLDMNLDPRRLEGARNFANKIWQAARFVLMNNSAEDAAEYQRPSASMDLELADRWILSRLNHLIQNVNRLFDSHQYGEAGRQINDFVWSEYCDWYIEASKVRLYNDDVDNRLPLTVLLHVLETSLRLLHPYMPFATEAIWQALPDETKEGDALIVAHWAEPNLVFLDDGAEESMILLMDLIRGIRNRRAEYRVTPGKRIPAIIVAPDAYDVLVDQQAVLCSLAKLDPDRLTIDQSMEPPSQAATIVVGKTTCYLPLAEIVDLEEERQRLSEELADVEGRIAHSKDLLAGQFAERAPEHVVQRERDKLKNLKTERAELERRLETLS